MFLGSLARRPAPDTRKPKTLIALTGKSNCSVSAGRRAGRALRGAGGEAAACAWDALVMEAGHWARRCRLAEFKNYARDSGR
jgi:hypothetical protein